LLKADGDEPIGAPLLAQSHDIVGGDFIAAGRASTRIKDVLKDIGLPAPIIRRVAICTYEAEMNVVMYARRGAMTLEIYPAEIVLSVEDQGPGIPDIELAMREGYSTATEAMRERGFGAGMGLPNIKKNSDSLDIKSVVGQGTSLRIGIVLT
jgi:anti-sigma regulatory factor (Ser/Thr protein kinase)